MHVGSSRMPMLCINWSAPIATLTHIATKMSLDKPDDHENFGGNRGHPFNQGGIGSLMHLLHNPILMVFYALSVVAGHMRKKFEEDGNNDFWCHRDTYATTMTRPVVNL